jgi:transcriptional regulator with XRE-family HTH domain
MKIIERETARALRRKGMSMNEIIRKTGYSKSSVSGWTNNIILTKKQRDGLSQKGRSIESIERRRKSRLFNESKKRQVFTDKAKGDFSDLSERDLKIIGSMIYWGEGGKTNRNMARLSNSDPVIIKVMMRYFREICGVPNSKFRASVHTFAYADIDETMNYWARVSGIPRDQFYKAYIKQSSASLGKRKTLPFGTLDIYVCDTKIFLTIMGWIEKISEILTKI